MPVSVTRTSTTSDSPERVALEMNISEIYAAEQGEGQYAGMPSVFVRTSGCNLRCWFCDTPHTSWDPQGEILALEEVIRQAECFPADHVVITGGEPLIQPGVVPLSVALEQAGRIVTIETAGTVFRPVRAALISLSPKLSNSTPDDAIWKPRHDQLRHHPETLMQFRNAYACQWKFVIDRPEDLAEVDEYVRTLQIPASEIWLMPQARTVEEVREKSEWLAREADPRGWKLSPRLHIEKYGNVRGK
jgi:7-carboxy-7-deazaguanine synthase